MERGAVLVACAVALAWPGAAHGDILGIAGRELAKDPLYVDPQLDRELFGKADERRVRRLIRDAGAGPVYVAVLAPLGYEEPVTAERMARDLAAFVREDGTYAVFMGEEFAAASTELERGEAQRLAASSLAERGDEGIAATLTDFLIDLGPRVRARSFGGGDFAPPPRAAETQEDDDDSSLPLIAGILAGLGLAGVGYLVGRR